MLTNADCTIYNRIVTNGITTYQATQLPNVHWFNDLQAQLSNGAIANNDVFKVRIPNTANYLPYDEWLALTVKTGKWTIQKDDIICKGLVSTAITGLATLTKLNKQAFKIVSYSDDRRGSLPHIRVGGV